MLNRTYILLMIAVIMFPACQSNSRYKDDFYNNNMSDLSKRLPLVKPYEALKSEGDCWTVEFHTRLSMPAAERLLVDSDRFIIGYGSSGTTVVEGKTVPYIIYFLIDLKNKKELLFYDSVKFRNELKEHGFSWSDMVPTDRLYSKYAETGLLPWLHPK
ncbi:MAG: hypothetical protein JST42_12180 [Bacteroidetes bacterium]|nr:hypothetical protein [Bacteroidota bacterium]